MKTLNSIKSRLASWARRPQIPVSSPVQPDSDSDVPLSLGGEEIHRFCALYGRAILMRICLNPRRFGFEPSETSILDYAALAVSLRQKLEAAIDHNCGKLGGVVIADQPVWVLVAKLTEIDGRIPKNDQVVEESISET